VKVTIGPGTRKVCPILLTKEYIELRGHTSKSAPFFTMKDGSLLTRARLQARLRAALTILGHPARDYGTHSLRIGSASAAAAAGVPMKLIKSMGRWRSECYRQYI